MQMDTDMDLASAVEEHHPDDGHLQRRRLLVHRYSEEKLFTIKTIGPFSPTMSRARIECLKLNQKTDELSDVCILPVRVYGAKKIPMTAT
jgi:hypothetical protein